MSNAVQAAIDLREELAESQLEKDFALAAFPVLLERRLAGTTFPPSAAAPALAPPGASASGADASAAQALAARLKRPVEELEDIYDFSADPVALIVSPGRLASAVARATEQIALLVVASRQAASNDAWTSASHIRAVCQDYARFDSSNFSGTLTSLHEEFAFRGTGRSRDVRLTRPGWDKVSKLLAELGG
jgi:hypothetical protein